MRRKRVYKKYHQPDPVHSRIDVSRFINYVMKEGKKSTAQKVVYTALEHIQKNGSDPIDIFEKAITNATPLMEVVSRRVGGANYQVPNEVRPERKFMLATRWIISAARSRKGKPMAQKLADEFFAAAKGEGAAIKKKQDMHRMAEANRAFAHFARR